MENLSIRKWVLYFALLALAGISNHVEGFVTLAVGRQPVNFVSLRTSTDSQLSNAGTSSLSAVNVPDMESYASGYKTVYAELPFKSCASSEGTIPADLVGTYFRCGPAMFSAGSIMPPKKSIVQPKVSPVPDGEDPERMVQHPFEGDGAVLGVTFAQANSTEDKTATARFRFIRTAGFTNERKKGRRLYTGMDSTRQLGSAAGGGLGNDMPLPLFRHHLQPGLNKNRKNTSNTRAIYWGKRLLTLWEGGLPYKLDALALSTDGRSQLGGIIKEDDPFGAKMAYDSKTDRALFYGVVQGSRNSELNVYEFNSKFRPVDTDNPKVTSNLPGFAMISDFCVTENYAVFVQPKVDINGMQYMLVKEPGKVLSVENKPSLLHLIARTGSTSKASSKTFTIPSDGALDAELQFCNAYEDNDNVVFDAIRSDASNVSQNQALKWPWVSTLKDYAANTAKKSLWRYNVNVKTGSVTKELLVDTHCSFGVINPAVSAQRHRYIYMNVGGMESDVAPPQGIAKFDCETRETQVWMPENYEFCGEPMYAQSSNKDKAELEDGGYILSVMYNGKKQESEMLVLQASDIAAGPIARIPLGISIPHGLYGCYAASEEASWAEDAIERRAKLSDKMESKGNMWNEVKSDFSGLSLRLDDIEEVFPDLL